jgi:hypothetical protein
MFVVVRHFDSDVGYWVRQDANQFFTICIPTGTYGKKTHDNHASAQHLTAATAAKLIEASAHYQTHWLASYIGRKFIPTAIDGPRREK